jgi:cell division protein FtsL
MFKQNSNCQDSYQNNHPASYQNNHPASYQAKTTKSKPSSSSTSSSSSSSSKGFSLIEIIIAVTLLIGVVAVALTMVVGGVKSSKTGQSIADLKTLAVQKNGEISNDLDKELKKFAVSQTLAGSINPGAAIVGYFDLLNESGCIVQKTSIIEPPIKTIDPIDPTDPPIKEQKSSAPGGTAGTRGGLGDIGEDIPSTTNTMDCSKATFGSLSKSTVARYRRQWVIAKDRPNDRDRTISVIIVDLLTNQIVRHETLVKVDGGNK